MWGSEFTSKDAALEGGGDRGAQAVVRSGVRCASQVLHRCAARCASQVLDRGAQADTCGATHVLDRFVQAVARGAARCELHAHGRGARTAVVVDIIRN